MLIINNFLTINGRVSHFQEIFFQVLNERF